ncbi:MAG: winged helix-turn-helix domain-containing protein [Thiohalocapsa sp.]
MRLSFGDFQIDTERFELCRNGQACALEPKVFDLIAFLATQPQQIFSHDELIARLWRGRLVADATLSTCIKNARKVLGDSGSTQRYIKTVRGRGYRFDAEITPAQMPSTPAPAPSLNDRVDVDDAPALLVLPFRAPPVDADCTQLADALANDLGTILTRIPLLRLSLQPRPGDSAIAASSVRALHEALGVDLVLDGTLRASDGQYRINAGLADARTGFQLWGEQFSVPGPLDEALRQAPTAIIAKLEPQLHRAIYNAVRSANGEPDARQLFLQASGILVVKGWRHDAFVEAAELLRRSRQQAPGFALAHALLSLVMGFGDRIGLMSDREQARSEALQAAERAMELDGMDATVLGYAGCALADIGQIDRALPILKHAVELSPVNAQAWVALGSVHLIQHQFEAGIRHLSHGIAISPLDSRLSIWGALLTVGLLLDGRLDEALTQGQLACQRDDRCYLPRVALAGVQLLREDTERAIQSLAEAYRIKPDLSRRQIHAIVGRALGVALQRLKRSAR